MMDLLKTIFEHSSMESLLHLILSGNDLTGLPEDFFDPMPHLQTLDLSHNTFFR